MGDYIFFDIETYRVDDDLTEIVDPEKMKLALGVSHDRKAGFKTWFESQAEEFIEYLLSFEKVVGFNIKHFDNTVLGKYKIGAKEILDNKSIDMMEVIEGKIGQRVSLQSLVYATLDTSKSADGKQSMTWWTEGRKDLVEEYCKKDVELTEKLFNYGIEHGHIYYDAFGQKRKFEIDWFGNNSSTRDSGFSYTIEDDDGRITELDPDDVEFFQAFELVRSTKEITYITGKAGTGKTTLLKYIRKHINKQTAIVAYTGVASINAGGATIHSFFTINPKDAPFQPNDKRLRFSAPASDSDQTTIFSHFQYRRDKRAVIEKLELLIIDEISMVRVDLLHVIDKLLRAFSGRGRHLPFGGVQVVLIGDLFQLPPIEDNAWELLDQFYDSPFFFSAPVLQETAYQKIELKTIHRQDQKTERDFIRLLNRVRINQAEKTDIIALNNRPIQITPQMFDDGFICLCSTNRSANRINDLQLDTLDSDEHTFIGEVKDDFPPSSYPNDIELKLKVGAQIMLIKNGVGYVNGTIGRVTYLSSDSITVAIKDNRGEIREIDVEKNTWVNQRFFVNDETGQIEQEVIGEYTQYPIKLAWAMTIHKSQGLTFEKVAVSVPFMDFFRPSGLVYVALSRCKSWDGLKMLTPLSSESIHVDPRIIEFGEQITPETLIEDAIQHGKANTHYSNARNYWFEGEVERAIAELIQAMKLRNDLESETFKRFVVAIGKRSVHQRLLYADLLKDYNDVNLTKENLTQINVRQEKALEDFNMKHAYALDELVELNKLIDELRYTDKEQSGRIDFFERKVSSQNGEISKLNQQVKELTEKNHSQLIEIKRLKNLSWFDKLFGAE